MRAASSGDRSPEYAPRSSHQDSARSHRLHLSSRSPLVSGGEAASPPSHTATIVRPDMSRSGYSGGGDFQSVLQAFPSVVLSDSDTGERQSLLEDIGRVAGRVADTVAADSGLGEAAGFQRNYISGVVSDAMEDWCSGLERRLWGMQYSILRQLDSHQAETRELVGQTGGLEELRLEVDRLREENRELRKFFGDSGPAPSAAARHD